MDYIALVHKNKNSDYGISFPDFPGCISAAETFDDVREIAEEALAFHIEGMQEDKLEIPQPTPVEKVKIDREDLQAMILINYRKPGKTVKVNMTMQEDIVRRATRKAKRKGLTRSAYFARLAEQDCA